ncbi:MAG: DUF2933 domain-containing protein [Syntrophomonadaceae bacterium]|nr:DUF2933 domain-containing protein [Syntrophomonadaceae bacterium]
MTQPTSAAGYCPYMLFLLCPLSHLIIMPLIGKKSGDNNADRQDGEQSPSCY